MVYLKVQSRKMNSLNTDRMKIKHWRQS